MTGYDRICKTLRHEEPDRVPTFEMDIARRVIRGIMPDASYEAFIEAMDIDALVMFELRAEHYESIDPAQRVVKNRWGAICKYGELAETQPDVIEPAIKSKKDLDNYKAPDPDIAGVYPYLEKWVKQYKGDRAVIAHLIDPHSAAREFILGFENCCIAMVLDQEQMEIVNEIVGTYYLKYVQNCIEIGVDAFIISHDLASNSGLLYSPAHIRKYIMPNLKKINDYIKSKGIPIIRHSDGNIWGLFDMFIDAGYDGVHPIDPLAGMDLGEVKDRYGEKLTLLGNVHCADTLVTGTTDDVREDVKRCMRQAAPGGGYICTSSNTIHPGVRPENYKAMLDAVKEFGRYPIKGISE